MLSLLLQVADTLQSAGSFVSDAVGAAKEVAPLVSVAIGTIGLYIGFKGRRAQRDAAREKAEAEEVKRLFTRKLRLPEYRDKLNELATNLDSILDDFPERQAEVQAEADEITRHIITTVRRLSEHLYVEETRSIAVNVRQIEDRAGVLNRKSGQHIRTCTRDIALSVTFFIDDERAQSI